jgi:hypothetical protein
MTPRRRLLLSGGVWTPKKLGGLVLWLDASKITGLNDGDVVTQWDDASGLENHATQSTTSRKPLYKINIINGRPVVRSDGVDDCLELAGPVLEGTKTIAVIGKLQSLPGASTLFSILTIKYDASNFSEFAFLNFAGYEEISFKHDFVSSTASVGIDKVLDTNPHIWIHTYNDGTNTSTSSYTAQIDGVVETVATSGNLGRTGTDKGSLFARVNSAGTGSSLAPVNIAEVLVYNRVLDSSEQAKLKTYAGRYGL